MILRYFLVVFFLFFFQTMKLILDFTAFFTFAFSNNENIHDLPVFSCRCFKQMKVSGGYNIFMSFFFNQLNSFSALQHFHVAYFGSLF